MKRIYRNRALRMNASAAVVLFAFVFGIWELWAAARAAPGESGYGYLFALLFIGGGIYGTRLLLREHADTVVALDADLEGGRCVVSLWRPFAPKRIACRLDRLTNWRFELWNVRANVRIPVLQVDVPDYPRPVKLELGKGIAISQELRSLAPEAVAASEASGTT